MAAPCRPCGEGRGLCHLRRIGTRAPVPGIADVIHFCKTVTLLGRKREVVDYFLSYAALREGEYISRIHARVIWTTSTYELVDSSLTGVYVNDIRISGKVALQEGDTVTFGNPAGSSIVPGAHVRQPNSPFYFLFEHCHCHVDQMQSPCGETNLPPELLAPASAETSPPVTSSLGLVNNIAPPRAAPALASAASMAPPVTSSLPTNVLNVTLLSPEALSQPRPAAGPFSAAGDRPASQRLRSASPDYTILGEGSLVAPESSPRRTLETTRSFLLQGAPESNGSRCLSGSKEQDAGRRPDSLQWFLRENGDAGTSPAPTCPLRTAPVCLEDPAAADDDDSPCERHVNTAGLSVGVLQLTPFFQREDGDDPGSKRSTSSTEELASGDSDHEDETMEVNPSPEETAEYGMSWVSEPDAWLMGGAASGPQVTSASRMEGESPAEEHGPSFMEEPLPEGSMLETNGTAEGSNSLAVKMWPFLPATLGNACPAASSRTAGGNSSGEKPEFADGTSSGEKPEFAGGTSSGEKPEFVGGTSSGEKPEFVDGTSPGEKPEFADGTSSGEKPEFADGTSPGEKPRFADGTSSGEKPEFADGTSSGEKPRFADGTSSGEKPEFADGTSSGEKPELADGTSSGEKPRFADGTSSGEKPEFADGTSSGEKPRFADGTSSGEKPEFASRDELGSEGARAASPPRNPACGMQSGGGGDYNMNSQGSVSDGERDMEMEPLAKAGSLAMGQRVGAGAFGALEPEMGSGGPEAVGGLGNGAMEPSCAEVGTQTEWAKGRESDGAIAGAAVDGDEGLSTQVAKEAFLQQLPAASPGAFAADEHSKGECSKQGEQRPAAPFGATQETPSSEDPLEPCEEERALAAACDLAPRDPVRMTGLIPEEPPGAPIPVAGCPAQSSTAAFEQKGEEMDAVAEKRLEHASPGCAETGKSLENRVADSTPGTEAEMAENDGPSLGAASALAAGSPGGEQQPSPKSSSEGMCQEAMDTEDPSGEEETEVKAATSSTVAAPGEDAADQKQLDGKETLERELSPAAAAQESVCGASAEGALARGPEGNAAPSSVDSAGRKAWPLSPFHLPGDDPGEGGIPRSSGRSCAGTPLSPQTSAKEGGGRLEAGSQQGGFEDERAVSLDDESMEEEQQQEVEVKGCEARAIPLVDASLGEAKMDSKQDDAQVGRLSDGQEQQGPFPDSSALSECQQESPVPVGQQNPEPDGLEPRGTDVGKEWLYSADSPTSEEVCEPDAALERATRLGPERYNKEIALSEEKDESGGFGQTPESPPCSEGSVSLPVGSVVFEMPGALKRSAAGNLPREARTDSAEVPGSWSSDELNLHISDSEAEKEESDSAWLSGTSSRSNLWGGRDALLWIPGAHLVGVAENSQACRKLSEQPPDPAPCDTVIQEARTGPLKGREMWQVGLGEETASRCESPGDRHDDALGRPQACSAEMVVGEKSPPPLAKTAAAAGAQEDQAEAGTELVPINLACLSVESSCLSQSEAEVGREDQAPGSADGLAEDACLDLAQDDRLVDDGFSSQPTVRTLAAVLEVGRTEQTESEMPTSLSSGKGERAQKTEVKEPVHPGQETELLPCQGNPRQLKDDQDSSVELSEGLDSSEYRRTLWQKEEELKGGSSRKRHFHADEDLRVSGVEDGSGLQKRLCPLDSAVVRGSASDPLTPTVATLPAPLDSEGRHDQFGRTLGNFLDQHSSQITPHLDEGEQKNRDSIAQIVRNYFKRPLCSNKPAAENEKAERLSLSPEAETGKDSPSVLETGANASCDELSSPEDQVQDASPGGQCWSAGASPPGSPAQEQGEDSARSTPESVWEAFFSEEEHFQMRVCSALRNAPSGSPVRSPDAAECALVSSEKNVDSILSDASDSSVDSDHWEPLPTQRSTIASGAGSPGLPTRGSGTAGKAAEVRVVPGVPREASNVDWCDKDPRTPSDAVASSPESSQPAASPLRPTADCPGMSAGGLPDGDGGHEASGMEDPAWDVPCVTATEGGQELAEGPSEMQTEEATVLQRRQADIQSQGMASEPAVGTREDGSPPQSATAPSPSPRQPERPFSLNPPSSAAGDGSAKAGGGAGGGFRSPEGGPSLFPLPSPEASSPTGMADHAEQGDFGADHEDDLCRNGVVTGFAGQAPSINGTPGDPGIFGTELAPGVCGLPALAGSLSASKGAAVSAGAWGCAPPVSRGFKEEQDWCDSQEQLASPGHGAAYPRAVSPGVSAFHEPRVPKALASRRPEGSAGPMDLGDEALLPSLLEAAEEPPGQLASDEDPGPCSTASPGLEEGASSVSREHPSTSGAHAHSTPCPAAPGTKSGVVKDWASSEQDVEFQLQECQAVLGEISRSLDEVEGIDGLHMEKWRNQIAVIQKATKMPQTHIAVVGNMGSGKSSLLNALLDAEAVLPTSAMRACTAVVVEISRAAAGSPYEADVEFLSREEWYKELSALLEDMKDKAGNFKKRCPDRNTEAGAAYSRVKAVYGRVDELAKLEGMQEVTQYLGTVQHVAADTAADFRTNIERFINSRTDNLREMKGGEFWPVVKCVRIRIAKAEVLKTGAVLVDLPGIRDSNAARDKVAKEYLKDCNAVWVVASITRAVDDKTAREMLSANLRRQLLMDGRYGSLAFVCTKTDSFNITDLVRDLQLQDEIQAIEDELAELENQKMQAEVEKRSLYEQLQQEQQRRGSEAADPAWLRRQHEVLEKEFRISALQREKDAKLRAISLICVQARNKFSKRQIAMDFSAGLEAMMREAAYPDYEEDDDEDLEDGEFASSESRNPRESQDRKLQVFTVSSTEYLKLCGKLLRDGQPQVFHDVKDTEIPALKKFAIDTALKHSMVATQKVIRDLARVLSQMVNYLTSQRAEDNSHRAQVQKIIQRSLQDLPGLLQEAIDGSLRDIQGYFDGLILASLRKGTAKAKELSEAIVRSWGSPVYGGCVYPTYRAACNRHGVYTSTSSNTPCVDFNSNLAEPIYKALSMPWHEVFSSKLIVSLDGFAKAVLARLKSFFRDLKRKLSQDRRLEEAIRAIGGQQMEAAGARLLNFTLDLNFNIELKHRMISRVLTPAIQARMEPAYTACTQMSGLGCFRRMKERMEAFIHNEKDAVFDAAAEKLQEELDLLQQYIRASFQSLVQELNKSLKMQFEPMLMSVQRNAKIIPELMDICAKVDKLCKRSCVDYVLPSPAQTEDSAPRVEQQLQRSPEPTSFSATFMDIRLGAVALPHIQQPKHSAGSPELPPRASAPPPLHGAIAVLQPPQFPPLSLRPYGQKRAAEAVEPQLQKKCKGPAPGAGCDPAGSALLWGTSGAKSELRAQGFAASRPLATASRAPALEDGKQKALGLPGAPLHCGGGRFPDGREPLCPDFEGKFLRLLLTRETSTNWFSAESPGSSLTALVDMKPDVEHVALPGSAGVLRVRAKEGIWGKCSNLNAEEEEKEGKMEIGRETRPADCSWMSH